MRENPRSVASFSELSNVKLRPGGWGHTYMRHGVAEQAASLGGSKAFRIVVAVQERSGAVTAHTAVGKEAHDMGVWRVMGRGWDVAQTSLKWP